MKELIKILKEFEKQRNAKSKSHDWNENNVAECFEPYARKILCEGYFLVNGQFIIDIGSIELYYHEEEGSIKDYIMYHTYAKRLHSLFYNDNGKYPYFDFGSFNFHQTGIDVTFENEDERYRASFLIRSYRVLKNESELKTDSIFDAHSTHIYDDMFPYGISFDSAKRTTIEWVQHKGNDFTLGTPLTRKNVAVYLQPDKKDNRVWDGERIISEADFIANRDKYIKVDKNHYYRQDPRQWRFVRSGITEKWN